MTPKPTHTPTPWNLGKHSDDYYHEGWQIDGPGICCIAKKEDAAFIVRAVNNFEYLLLVAKGFRNYLKTDGKDSKELDEIIAAATMGIEIDIKPAHRVICDLCNKPYHSEWHTGKECFNGPFEGGV